MLELNGHKIKLQLTRYRNDNSLAITAMCYEEEYKYWEPYGTLTVNLNYDNCDPAPEDCAYLDTNNIQGIEEFITENKLGEFTGIRKQSGYCTYSLYRFDMTKIKSIIAEQDKE